MVEDVGEDGEAREGAAVIAVVGGSSQVGELEALGFFWGQSGPFQWGSSRVGEGARRPVTLTSGTPCEAVSVEIWRAAVSGHNLGAHMLGLDVIFFKLRVYVLIRVQMAIAANCGMLSQI